MGRTRNRTGWQRVSDVQVPYGVLWVLLVGLWLRKRSVQRALEEFRGACADLGTSLVTRMREGDEREQRLLELQGSVEQLTRWLVRLTIVLGIIGIAGIVATLWAALK